MLSQYRHSQTQQQRFLLSTRYAVLSINFGRSRCWWERALFLGEVGERERVPDGSPSVSRRF